MFQSRPLILAARCAMASLCLCALSPVPTLADPDCDPDTTPPSIYCPENALVPTLESAPPAANREEFEALGGAAFDNCDPDVTVEFINDEQIEGTSSYLRTYRATDDSGNSAECLQTITTCTLAIECPPAVTVAAVSDVPGATIQAEFEAQGGVVCDNCPEGGVTLAFDDQPLDSGELIWTRTYFATDQCGNTAECIQLIFICNELSLECPPEITVANVNSFPPGATNLLEFLAQGGMVCNNCEEGDDVVFAYLDFLFEDNMWIRTYFATDECGRTAQCDQSIIVTGGEPPTIACPPGTAVQCNDQVPAAAADLQEFLAAGGTVNGGCTPVVLTHGGDASMGSCPRTITRTYLVTDACGQTAQCTQLITVNDTIPPTITCPAGVSVSCDEDVPPAANDLVEFVTQGGSAADNCGTVTVTHVGDASDGQSCPHVIARIYRATDSCGNSADCTQTITIHDTTAPTLSCPADVSAQCEDDVPPAATNLAELTAQGGVASDDCEFVAVTHVGDASNGLSCPATITRTYLATDFCGNTAQCTQLITVFDTTPPTIACPPPASVQCDGDVPAAANDLPELTAQGGSADDNCETVTVVHVEDAADGQSCPTTITRRYRATDSCGNSAECMQIITVNDTTPPSVACPPAVTVQCDALIPAAATNLSQFKFQGGVAGDNCGRVSITFVSDVADGQSCPKLITRTYQATDACGNSAQCAQIIEVNDTTTPTIACPPPFSVQCDSQVPPAATNLAQFTVLGGSAADNCGAVTVTHVGDASNGQPCPRSITRTYRAMDACGNTAQCTQIITVNDTIPPVIVCPPEQSLACGANTSQSATGTATATDNCDPNPQITSSDTVFGDCPATITRVWRATDACGNSATCTQIIHTAPACPACNGSTVSVDSDVTINFNTNPPTYSGDPDLLPYFTYDNSGPSADAWKAIFNVGPQRLVVRSGATITTGTVPATSNNRRAPGLEIRSTCTLEVEPGGVITVNSLNQPAGPIVVHVDGNVLVNGSITNGVSGTNGTPGAITVKTACGTITTGPQSRIVTTGQDHGGADICLVSCGPGAINGGDITINGLVDASYRSEHAATINIDAAEGGVTIDGNTLIEIEAGTQRRVTSGVTVRSRRDPLAGRINIQAQNDVVVVGNRILTTNVAQQNYGAVAIKPGGTNGTSGDGAMVVVSLTGKIIAMDRAFDFANRFNALNDLTLSAYGNIELSVTSSLNAGASNNSKAVVTTQGGTAGQGGQNVLRSYHAGVLIGANAQVLADYTGSPGTNGTNALTSCTGVVNNGLVKPADTNAADNSSVCTPLAPSPALTLCGETP